MNFRRLTAIVLIVMMLLTLFTGCKSNVPDEEEALSDSIVEGEEQQMSGDTPDKVEPGNTDNQQGSDNEGNETPDNTTPDNKQEDDKKEENTPSNDNKEPEKEDNTPSTDNEATTPDDNGGEGEGTEGGPDPNLEGVDEGNFLKIIAYNIRCADDGLGANGSSNDIADRAPRFKALVDELNADILALSEASVKWITYLEQNIVGTKYKMLYKYRAEDSLEAQPLLFDQTKFDLLDDGYFWLSETPNIPSKGWGGAHYRGVTWAKLKIKATGKQFLYYSTHLTGSDVAVIGSCNLIVDHALKQGGFTKIPVFVSGDYNTEPWSPGYSEFVQHFTDFNDYLGFDETYTNGGYTEVGGGNHIIDYMMGSTDQVIPTHYEVLHRKYLGGFISDHKGIYGECYIK